MTLLLNSIIAEGFLGREWCKEKAVEELTGCDVKLVQNTFRVMPIVQNTSNMNKATYMLEDALFEYLGAEESKCRLLYDMTASYSEVSQDGIIQMRNPLNSNERIWSHLINIPFTVSAEDGCRKYYLPPFISKVTDDKVHNLKCTIKICMDNFNVELCRCDPYAMIIGRQKCNVGIALKFVRKAILEYRKKVEYQE